MQRTVLALAFGFLAGGAVGAYAMSTIYGDHARTSETRPAECPPCAQCEKCPPPTDCGAPPPVVSAENPTGVVNDDDSPPPSNQLPGLPTSAIALASAALGRELAPCREAAKADGVLGSFVLDLTVTATSGLGRIRHVEVSEGDGNVETLKTCVTSAVERVQFEWHAGDGETKLRYPMRIN